MANKAIINTSIILLLTLLFSIIYYLKLNLPLSVNTLDLTCGYTDDFSLFLKSNNYSSWNFDRSDVKCGAFGGKSNASDHIAKTPIIFIHGNSDVGFGRGTIDNYTSWQTGFRQLAIYLGSQGYRKAELYTTTWGAAVPSAASQNNHAKKYVLQIRAFVEAVLAYTKAPQVNIIGHSMGVSLGRKITQGGTALDEKEGNYSVGFSLKDKIKNFIGLAGANLGLNPCMDNIYLPTCSDIDGFNPGANLYAGPSKFLASLNASPGSESTNIYTIWSKYDQLIGSECMVWGKITSRIFGQKEEVVRNTSQWNHFAIRDKSGPDIVKWLS